MTLKSPQGLHTRPTSSRTREAIWNTLQSQVQGSKIVDLFSGSGAVGIEGLSRGAKSCIFIENNRNALEALKDNIRLVKERAVKNQVAVEVDLLGCDAVQGVSKLNSEFFEVVWTDPPYDMVPTLIPQLWEPVQRILAPTGIWVIESDHKGAITIASFLEKIQKVEAIQKQKSYGKTMVSFISKFE